MDIPAKPPAIPYSSSVQPPVSIDDVSANSDGQASFITVTVSQTTKNTSAVGNPSEIPVPKGPSMPNSIAGQVSKTNSSAGQKSMVDAPVLASNLNSLPSNQNVSAPNRPSAESSIKNNAPST